MWYDKNSGNKDRNSYYLNIVPILTNAGKGFSSRMQGNSFQAERLRKVLKIWQIWRKKERKENIPLRKST